MDALISFFNNLRCYLVDSADKMGGVELNKRQQEEKRQKDNRDYDNLFKVPKQKEIRKARKVPDKRRSGLYPFMRPTYR